MHLPKEVGDLALLAKGKKLRLFLLRANDRLCLINPHATFGLSSNGPTRARDDEMDQKQRGEVESHIRGS